MPLVGEAKRAWGREHRKDPEVRARLRENTRRHAAKKRAWLAEYKLARGCIDCGYAVHAAALDFDHVFEARAGRPSLAAVGRFTWETLKAEVTKCEVRCANCHRVRTAERRIPCH